MATPNEKLASSLALLAALQQTGRSIVRSSDLTRTHLGRLVAAGYLQPVVKGWYLPARPSEQAGETTGWFASMKSFVRGYCDERFGEDWYVNAELSLQLGQLRDVSALSRILLDGGNSVVAGRLAGGLEAIGRSDLAAEVLLNMRS